jgi:PAS domain S-box-containing protein
MLTIKMILVFVSVFIAWMAVEIIINRLVPLVKEVWAAKRKFATDEKALEPFEDIGGASFDTEKALMEIRQAVAQAIATEKQLEQQLEKNISQAATWENRANMALEQNNQVLADQAIERQKQYLDAVAHLTEELEISRKSTTSLQRGLTDVELLLRKNDSLKARNRNADTLLKFNKHFAALLTTYALAQNKLVEEKLHGIIDEMPAGLMVVDGKGQVLAVNPQIEAMTGISADDMCHKISADTIFMQSDEVTLSSKIKEIAGKGIYSTHVRTNNEVWTPADVTISRITSGDYIICVLDATTRAKL